MSPSRSHHPNGAILSEPQFPHPAGDGSLIFLADFLFGGRFPAREQPVLEAHPALRPAQWGKEMGGLEFLGT